MIKLNKLYNECCLQTFNKLSDESIDLIVCSPPYYVNKEYEKSVTYQDYCDMMVQVFSETSRCLTKGGYAVINFGDYFNSGNRFYESDIPACYPASINYFRWGVDTTGLDLQATRIWRKNFARMGIPFVCNTHPRPVFDYEHVWTFRKKNGSKTEFVNDRKKSQIGVIEENWTSSAGTKKHPSSFPIELPLWAIDVYSKRESDVVYDPFMGSGTTIKAAIIKNRKYIGSEIDPSYFEIACERINES